MTNSTSTYLPGQPVEVRVADFTTPGMPYVWVSAEVVEVVKLDNTVIDVLVARRDGKLDRNGNPAIKRIMTTYRSRRNIRPAA